jgi:hypothetical protein
LTVDESGSSASSSPVVGALLVIALATVLVGTAAFVVRARRIAAMHARVDAKLYELDGSSVTTRTVPDGSVRHRVGVAYHDDPGRQHVMRKEAG